MEALILIDVQKGFLKDSLGKRNNLQAEENMLKILNIFRKKTKKLFIFNIFQKMKMDFYLKKKTENFKMVLSHWEMK